MKCFHPSIKSLIWACLLRNILSTQPNSRSCFRNNCAVDAQYPLRGLGEASFWHGKRGSCGLKEAFQNCFLKREREERRKVKASVRLSATTGGGELITLFLPESREAAVKNFSKTCRVSSTLFVMFCSHYHFSLSGNSICPYYAKVTK